MARYDIFLNNQAVGEVCIETVGLYTKFKCRCYIQNKGKYRIIAQYGSIKADLGICIPENNGYVAYAKIPTKHLSNDVPRFYVIQGSSVDTIFVPVQSNDAFVYITKLPEARFHIQEGETGLLIYKN